MKPIFAKAAADYHAHRPAFAAALYQRLREHCVGIAGQRILDLAAGTGLFTEPVRGECDVVSLDLHDDLLRHADGKRVVGRAEAIPFADESFDCIVAAQCWHWLDRRAAPREILRVLKPGARLSVVYQTYIPLPESIAAATEALILRHRPAWRHANSTGINGQVLRDIQIAGFERIESFSFDLTIVFTRESWHGFIRTTSPVAPSMIPEQLKRFDHDHGEMLKASAARFEVPHRVFCVLARKPGQG